MARASRTSCRDGSYELWTFEISERVSRASALFALRPRAGSLRIAVRSLSWHSYVAIRCARRSSLRGHSPAFPVRDLERAGASRPQLVALACLRACGETRAQGTAPLHPVRERRRILAGADLRANRIGTYDYRPQDLTAIQSDPARGLSTEEDPSPRPPREMQTGD